MLFRSQAGGERAGRRIQIEVSDVEMAAMESPLIRKACPETIRRVPVVYGDQTFSANVRGVCPEYGEIRSEVAMEGRWLSPEDETERRRVVFLGDYLKKKLFSGRQAVGETVTIQGVRFTVIGIMDKKISFGNYWGPDDRSAFIPYSAAGDVWNNRYVSTVVLQPIHPQFEEKAEEQFRDRKSVV